RLRRRPKRRNRNSWLTREPARYAPISHPAHRVEFPVRPVVGVVRGIWEHRGRRLRGVGVLAQNRLRTRALSVPWPKTPESSRQQSRHLSLAKTRHSVIVMLGTCSLAI